MSRLCVLFVKRLQLWSCSNPSSPAFVRYDYNSYCTDVTKFPRPRFASEFGFQSYPSFDTMADISGPEASVQGCITGV